MGNLNFYFNEVSEADSTHYVVSVIDNKGKAHIFKMRERKGAWYIDDRKSCNLWILSLENEFSNCIRKYHTKESPKETTQPDNSWSYQLSY